jgi:hypothetical protein
MCVVGETEPSEQIDGTGFGRCGVDAPQPGDELEILERRELVVDHRLVGDPRHDLLGRHRIGERVDAEHRDRAGVRPQQPDHHPQGRGLAGAVGTEQRVELARPHGQVEPIDGGTLEALGQAADLEGPGKLRFAHRVPEHSACQCHGLAPRR